MRGKFTAKFDFTFPSRAMVSYPAGWTGVVKAEVGRAAVAAGVFEEGPGQASDAPDTLPGDLSPELAEPQALTPNLHVDTQSD